MDKGEGKKMLCANGGSFSMRQTASSRLTTLLHGVNGWRAPTGSSTEQRKTGSSLSPSLSGSICRSALPGRLSSKPSSPVGISTGKTGDTPANQQQKEDTKKSAEWHSNKASLIMQIAPAQRLLDTCIELINSPFTPVAMVHNALDELELKLQSIMRNVEGFCEGS